MPTQKPRLTITLSTPTYKAIEGVAKERGVSKTKVIAETMDAVAPVLERIATMLQAAKSATGDTLHMLRASAEESESEMTRLMAEGIDQLDLLEEKLRKH
jgi:hypothetical protein